MILGVESDHKGDSTEDSEDGDERDHEIIAVRRVVKHGDLAIWRGNGRPIQIEGLPRQEGGDGGT